MGLFSDPAAASIEFGMDGLSLGYETTKGDQSPSTPTRSTRNMKNRPRRVKSFDPSSPAEESPRMPAKVRNLRRSSTLGAMKGPRRDSASFGRRESLDSVGSAGGGAMHEHLIEIETFCHVMKGAGSKERNRMLRDSLKAKEGAKRKDSR